jgi:hypothetical protein
MSPLWPAEITPVVFTAHRQNVKSIWENPLAPLPDPGHSKIEQAPYRTATRLRR